MTARQRRWGHPRGSHGSTKSRNTNNRLNSRTGRHCVVQRTGNQQTSNDLVSKGDSRYRGVVSTRATRRLLSNWDQQEQRRRPFLNHRFSRLVQRQDEVDDGWKGGNFVNGRSSRVTVAKGHPRSRGQLVRRVKGFQDREQVDVETRSARTHVLFTFRMVSLVSTDRVACQRITRRSPWLMTTGLFRSKIDTGNDCWLVLKFWSMR